MKKLFLGILFATVAIVITFKGYIWFKVYSELSQLKEQLAPHAMIKYDWIFSSFDGEVGVRGVEITPYLLKGTITIDELSLKVADAATLFKLGDTLSRHSLPDQLNVRMRNMSLPLKSDIATFANSFDASIADNQSTFNPFGVYSCGDTAVVTGDELKTMGYDNFTVSSDIGYRLNPVDQTLTVSAVADSESMGRSELTINLGVSESAMNLVLAAQRLPDLNSLTWEFHDAGYFRRLSFYCGKKTGTERNVYVTQAANEWDADLQDHGITLNRSLVDAYRQYILDGGLLRVDIRPDRDIDYSALSLFSANDIVNMLNLRIKINNEWLSDLSLKLDDNKVARLFGEEKAVNVPKPSDQTAPAIPQEPVKRYQAISIDEVEHFLKYPVQVELDSGKLVEGTVIAVDEHIIEVEQVVTGGRVSYPLRKRNITLIKIWK